ncbi:hypothetical protein C0583_01420 [Candidatus Parcubacteria bacterium]|nr:MAG: hypothetical protein C0583_01420 [Candidatus Parcubacteria bacterium]
MLDKTYKRANKDINKHMVKKAQHNNAMWFYNLHIKEVVECARQLLPLYNSDEKVVTLACWLHDVSLLYVESQNNMIDAHKIHHTESAKIADELLKPYKMDKQEKDLIISCVQYHRNKSGYQPKKTEEKIVAVADAMSHFTSLYYFTYFKFNPNDSLEEMILKRKKQIEKDWNKLDILPKSKKIVKDKYLFFKELINNYT